MLWFIVFLSPALLSAGTIYYVDETPSDTRIEEEQEPPPRPMFPHPQLEPEYQLEQDYYFREQHHTEKVIYKKDSNYFDLNYAWIELKISDNKGIEPKYDLQRYTNTYSTTTTDDAGNTTTADNEVYVSESFSIDNYGTAIITFPTHENADEKRQPGYQFNAVTRNGHIAYGVEVSYQNIATLVLQGSEYTITQTQSSTSTTTSVDGNGNQTVSAGVSAVSELTANLHIDELSIKVVDLPINFTMMYFPIYDGYFQPYLKAGLGLNMTYTTMTYTLPPGYEGPGTFSPFFIDGWSVYPFCFTYGAGLQVMISEGWALHMSYLEQSLPGQTPQFTVIAIDQDENSANQAYGDIRFKFKQRATLMQLGLAYYF